MPFEPGQSGNPSGRPKGRPWADAIKRALARAEAAGNGKDLNSLADKLLEAVANGDLAAAKELGDRLDGKPHQTQEMDVRGSLTQAIEALPRREVPKLSE